MLHAARVNMSMKNLFLTIVSYIFYGWLNPWYISLMWVSTLLDYNCGKQIARPDATKRRRNTALLISMVGNLGMLGFFKYAGFFADSVNRVAMLLGADGAMLPVLQIFLPAGISFYTFQTMSYTIDVWRGDAPPVKDMATFSCFVALFPQLIAGPIIRYQTVAEQLSYREHNVHIFVKGLALFIMGLAKKILLADSAALIADAAFGADTPDVLSSWIGILGYSFQIYFDFCGYSDMAVGLGRMFGFEFIKNFNAPYHAKSITEFWTRWHISLSTWIRDYLYISLGGNRGGTAKTYRNLVIAFFLSGLWHGNQLHFLMWGIYQGAWLFIERLSGKKPFYAKLPPFGQFLFAQVLVLFGWVLFRAPSLDQAWDYWKAMLGLIEVAPSAALLRSNLLSVQHITTLVICSIFTWQSVQAHNWVENMTRSMLVIVLGLLVLAIIMMFTQAFSPFLYFQF
jgi:alginate O-acetyltransferase complex protein AlgI